MRVGMVSHWYDPEGGAAAGPGTIARALHQRGHRVGVVTGFPIYPSGRVADGYRIRPYQRQVMEGVAVHRAPIYPSHDDRAMHRMANYLSFAASGSAVATATLKRSDVLYVYSSPATAAIPALPLSVVGRIPMVVHIQDLWPQTVTASGFVADAPAGRMERALHRFCDLVYSRATTIAVSSPGMADLIADRGIPRGKLRFLPNWAEEKSFHPTHKDRALESSLGLKGTFTAMYAGNFGEMQQLDTVLDAAALLLPDPDIEIVLVGDGVMATHLRGRVDSEGLTNVKFVAPQPFKQMSAVLALGDVQLISLKDVPLYRSTLPSKLQATLAAGRPVIGALSGDAASIIADSKAGLVTAPGDPYELSMAIRSMKDAGHDWRVAAGLSARSFYAQHFSEQAIGDELVSILTDASKSAT